MKMTGKSNYVLLFMLISLMLNVCAGSMINIRNLDESDADSRVWREEIEVYESSSNYYFYNVYTENGDIFV